MFQLPRALSHEVNIHTGTCTSTFSPPADIAKEDHRPLLRFPNATGKAHMVPKFLFAMIEVLVRGCRRKSLEKTIVLNGNSITTPWADFDVIGAQL